MDAINAVCWLAEFLADGAKTVARIQDAAWEQGLHWRAIKHAAFVLEVRKYPPLRRSHSQDSDDWEWALPMEEHDGQENHPAFSERHDPDHRTAHEDARSRSHSARPLERPQPAGPAHPAMSQPAQEENTMTELATWQKLGRAEQTTDQLTSDEVTELRQMIGKPSQAQAPRVVVDDPLIESVYRSTVTFQPSAEGRRSRCAHCGFESTVRDGRARHLAACELAKLYLRAGGGRELELVHGSALAGVRYERPE
jgi:hypothetical protein